MLTALFIAAGVITYLNFGYFFVGKNAVSVWEKKDNRSLTAFLLFPILFASEEVGARASPPCALQSHAGYWQKEEQNGYKSILAMIWPLKIALNIPSIALLAVPQGFKAIGRAVDEARQKREKKKKEIASQGAQRFLCAPGDDSHALLKKKRLVVAEIQGLIEDKKNLEVEIERKESEMKAALEIDKSLEEQFHELEQEA